MLTIKSDPSNWKNIIELNKASLCTLLKNTKLEYLTKIDTYHPDTTSDFQEIVTNINGDLFLINKYDHDNNLNSWNILCEFLNKKTIFNEAPIIKNYENSINKLAETICPSMIMEYLRYNIISQSMPLIITNINCESIYEQLIFYEYIYKSENISYEYKLIVIVENKYKWLIEMLENCELDICTSSLDDNDVESTQFNKFKNIRLLFNHDKDLIYLIEKFVEIHSSWLGIDVNELNNQLELKLLDTSNNSDVIKQINEEGISVRNLCLLNKVYQTDKTIALNILEQIKPFFIRHVSLLDKTYIEQQIIYEGLDLIVRLMEDNNQLVANIPKRNIEKIFTLWLKMSAPGHISFSSSKKYPRYTRYIQISPIIKNVIEMTAMTFSEMGYILASDRVDIFKILCKNLNFNIIHSNIFTFLPPKILLYITDNSSRYPGNLPNIDIPESFEINIYDLLNHTPITIKHVFSVLNEIIDSGSCIRKYIKIIYNTIINNSSYVDTPYILMYWSYLTILKNNPDLIPSIVQILSEIMNNNKRFILGSANLDIIILKIVFDANPIYKNIDDMKIINAYIDMIVSDDHDFIICADFIEIRDELIQYAVPIPDFLEQFCNRQNTIVY